MIKTKYQMYKIIATEQLKLRDEAEIVPQGLSLTETDIARYYRWREGNAIATLRQEFKTSTESFTVEHNE